MTDSTFMFDRLQYNCGNKLKIIMVVSFECTWLMKAVADDQLHGTLRNVIIHSKNDNEVGDI